VTSKQRAAYGFAFFVLFVALWAWATFGGYVSKTFLANPLTMVQEGFELLTRHGFVFDIGMTIWRVVGGFVLAALVAVPLGVLMGAYKPIEAFLEPFVSFARYLPASAFIPLLILWAGIGELQKLLVIFIGSVFQIILMVTVSVGATRRDLVEAAYTLGAANGGIIRRVLLPSSAPDIAEILRLDGENHRRQQRVPDQLSAHLAGDRRPGIGPRGSAARLMLAAHTEWKGHKKRDPPQHEVDRERR
jgi:NitT/TauT family transport system permease protein